MKAVILAGGLGTRISEESHVRPKPMVEIGGRPILWHIMKIFGHHGITEFVICLGYKGYVVKEYFANYWLHTADVTFRMATNSVELHGRTTEPWTVTLVDTGESTMTGGRLKRVAEHLGDEPFCVTYGDGVADIDIGALVRFHAAGGRLVTVTAVRQPGRYGTVTIGEGAVVTEFDEKPPGGGGYINGGFFVLSPGALDYIEGDRTSWEQEPLTALAAAGELGAYVHDGYWQSMDTLREKNKLEELYLGGRAPWVVWE